MTDESEKDFIKIGDQLERGQILVANSGFSGSRYHFFRVESFTKGGNPRLVLLQPESSEEYCTKGGLECGSIVKPSDQNADHPIILTKSKEKEYLSAKIQNCHKSLFLDKYDPNVVYRNKRYG